LNKNGAFLVIFILLLGIAVIPVGPDFSATQIDQSSSVNVAALASTETLKVPVAEDTSVVNGSEADNNFDGMGALVTGVADMGEALAARSWLKFNLAHLPLELSITSATISIYLMGEFTVDDRPFGIYHCSDDTWDVGSITWNNQPTFSTAPSDVIDSPVSPNMFVEQTWYTWDITSDVRSTLDQGDMILTEVLKQVDETESEDTFKGLTDMETFIFNASYIEIEYTTPTVSELTVDGIASGTPLEYINNPSPELGWTFSDPDSFDFQRDYDVEIWNNTYYNETLLWQKSHEFVSTIHDSDSTNCNTHPFGSRNEFRMQLKYPSTEIPRSGIVDKLYFTSYVGEDETAILEDFEISLLMVSSGTALTSSFTTNYEGRTPTIVMSRDSYEISVVDNVIEVDVENTFFVYENLNLIIEIRLMNNTGDLIAIDRTNTGGPGSCVYSIGEGDYVATTAENVFDRTYDLKIGYLTQTVYDGGASTNAFPFGVDVGYPGRFQIKYNQSYVNRAGYLDKMYFPVTSINGEVVYENFTISIVETPVLGQIDHVDMESNYGGLTPVVVLDQSMYTVRNLGNVLVIDFDNSYYYSNTNDLLIEFQWDSLVSGHEILRFNNGDTSSYRSWDVRWGSIDRYDNGTAGYNLYLDFVNNEVSTPLDGCITLIEETRYYWRVRTCDSTGVWGDWATANFKFETISELPVIDNIIVQPLPVEVNHEVSVSVDATHSLGMYAGYIEFGGANHSMTLTGDTFSYAWSPVSVGLVDYTIYVHSNGNTWASFSDQVNVTATSTDTGTGTGTGTPGDMTMILIVVGAAAVVIVIIVIIMKKKK